MRLCFLRSIIVSCFYQTEKHGRRIDLFDIFVLHGIQVKDFIEPAPWQNQAACYMSALEIETLLLTCSPLGIDVCSARVCRDNIQEIPYPKR